MSGKMDTLHDFEEKIMEVKDFYIEFFKKTLLMGGSKSGFDFTLSEIKALGAFRWDKDYTMGELSQNAQVAMPSMTEMVDKLEKHGIAERYRDGNDRRVVKVRLTSKGRRLRKEFMQRRLKEMKEIFGKLSKQELNDLIKSLKKARYILEKVEIGIK